MNECKIVEDLLPLYAEDLVSEQSSAFVREHTASCGRCRKLLERTKEPMPAPEEDPCALQKALHRDTKKLVGGAILRFFLITAVVVGLIVGGFCYYLWETGELLVEQVFEAPDGDHWIQVSDWDSAGFFENGQGSVVKFVIQSRNEYGAWHGSSGITHRNWENLDGAWSLDCVSFLATVDLVEGGKGIFLFTGTGENGSPIRWEGTQYENGLITVLTGLCEIYPGFPTGWETVEFAFLDWADDSQTITFVYETDNGFRGFLDYHFPTETITAVE